MSSVTRRSSGGGYGEVGAVKTEEIWLQIWEDRFAISCAFLSAIDVLCV